METGRLNRILEVIKSKKLYLVAIATVIIIAAVCVAVPLLSPPEHPQNVVQIYCTTPDAQITFYDTDNYDEWTVRFIDGVAEYHFDPYPHQIKPAIIGYKINAPGYFEAKGAFTVEYELNWMTFSIDLVRRH